MRVCDDVHAIGFRVSAPGFFIMRIVIYFCSGGFWFMEVPIYLKWYSKIPNLPQVRLLSSAPFHSLAACLRALCRLTARLGGNNSETVVHTKA